MRSGQKGRGNHPHYFLAWSDLCSWIFWDLQFYSSLLSFESSGDTLSKSCWGHFIKVQQAIFFHKKNGRFYRRHWKTLSEPLKVALWDPWFIFCKTLLKTPKIRPIILCKKLFQKAESKDSLALFQPSWPVRHPLLFDILSNTPWANLGY